MPRSTPQPTPEFIQLLTTHQSRLFGYALSLLGNRHHAQEVMQETNLVMWRKCDQFQSGTNFAAWMMKIAYYQTQSYRRKLAKGEVFIEDEDFLAKLAGETESAAADNALHEQRQEALQKCLEKLPDRQRNLVRERYSEGNSIKAIAERINLAASAVKQALFRARTSLISCVKYRMKEVEA